MSKQRDDAANEKKLQGEGQERSALRRGVRSDGHGAEGGTGKAQSQSVTLLRYPFLRGIKVTADEAREKCIEGMCFRSIWRGWRDAQGATEVGEVLLT